MTPRLRGGRCGCDVGVLGGVGRPGQVRAVVARPLRMPGAARSRGLSARSHSCVTTTPTPVSTSWARASGTRHEPGQPLQLVLAQPGPGDAQPDDDDRDDERP